jgi:hypothetical protein
MFVANSWQVVAYEEKKVSILIAHVPVAAPNPYLKVGYTTCKAIPY